MGEGDWRDTETRGHGDGESGKANGSFCRDRNPFDWLMAGSDLTKLTTKRQFSNFVVNFLDR